jgi:hypothetical protein
MFSLTKPNAQPGNKRTNPVDLLDYKDPTPRHPSPADFHVYEARAHQLRAEAAHNGARAIAKFVKSQFVKLAHLFAQNKPA